MNQPERVVVIGAGYVGLVTAVGLAGLGHDVTVVEKNQPRCRALGEGHSPFFEADLQEALDAARAAGRFHVADGLHKAATASLWLVCVGTPIDEEGEADLTQVEAALRETREVMSDMDILVIRSTMAPGSTAALLEAIGIAPDRTFVNPEFLRQGTALSDYLHPDRVVVGHFPEHDRGALQRLCRLYEPLGAPIIVTSVAAAELIKNGANAFLALKLSFAAEIATLSEAYGADIDEVLDGITRDPRIGSVYMGPSFGFGGSCLPKELRAVTHAGQTRGLPMFVTRAASEANLAHQERFVDRIERAADGLTGRRIAILGLAFKAGTDDIRESPALRVARLLFEAGADLVAHDPEAEANAKRAFPELEVAPTPGEAVAGSDAVVIATDWPQYRALDWPALYETVRTPLIIDGRRALDPRSMRAIGFRYVAFGSPDSADQSELEA